MGRNEWGAVAGRGVESCVVDGWFVVMLIDENRSFLVNFARRDVKAVGRVVLGSKGFGFSWWGSVVVVVVVGRGGSLSCCCGSRVSFPIRTRLRIDDGSAGLWPFGGNSSNLLDSEDSSICQRNSPNS